MLEGLLRYFSFTYAFIVLALVYTLFFWARRWKHNQEVRALGGHATILKTWVPFGMSETALPSSSLIARHC